MVSAGWWSIVGAVAVIVLVNLGVPTPAQQDSVPAVNEGFQAYLRGDYPTAVRLWRQRADRGEASGQFGLGLLYLEGYGVRQDFVEAVGWFRKAAAQDDTDAQLKLGRMYRDGKGVGPDLVQAYLWLNLAAAKLPSQMILEERNEVAARMTPAQIAEAQKLAREWKPESERHQ
jgi:TPR repeat protein